jgi:hypothetical protein
MHKSDPYIMALAMSESNRRKEMRAAGQGGQGMQEQPKVVDSEIAQMAPQQMPEDQGIGQLPAGEMNFAGGGIIAFADGGDVERYQVGGAIQSKYQQELQEMGMGTRMQYSPDVQAFVQAQEQASRESYADRERARMLQGPYGRTATPAQAAPMAAPTPRVEPVYSPADVSGMDRRLMSGSQPSIASLKTPLPTKAAPTADTTRRGAPGAGLGAAAAAAAAPKDDPFSMSSIRKAQTEAMGDSNYKIGELNNQLVDIRNRAETQVQQRLEDRKKEIESEGDVYKDRSDRLVERGKALAGQKDQNTGLALLNAGLAIMSTPGGLMTAIGKGAQVGTAQYAAGIKDLRAAQERLDEANDRISELRMNRKDLNSREIRALEKDRDAAILDGQKMVFGFAKDIYGMDRKQAEATFTSYMSGQEKQADIRSRENTARIAAGPGYERNRMLRDAQGNESKVRAEYGKLQAKVMDNLSKDANYQTANPAMQSTMYTNALRQAVSTNPFLASYASGIGFSSAPTGKVYDLTED